MNPQTIAEIVKLILEITLEIIRDMPVEMRREQWERTHEMVKVVEKLFKT